ncbi:twin-arginine translocation signal domain-containing protein [Micromonospora sp. NPDC004704]
MQKLDRRGFLGLTGAAGVGLAAAVAGLSDAPARATGRLPTDLFKLGVASGDPRQLRGRERTSGRTGGHPPTDTGAARRP